MTDEMKREIRKELRGYVTYRATIEQIRRIPTKEAQLEMFWAIAEYALESIEPKFVSQINYIMWPGIQSSLDDNLKNKKNGDKGGRPKKTTGKTTGFKSNNQGIYENDNDNNNDNEKENDNESETESHLSLSLSFKEGEAGEPSASADAAAAPAPPFTLKDFEECAEAYSLELPAEEIRKCYNRNKAKGFTPPAGAKSFSILAALNGWKAKADGKKAKAEKAAAAEDPDPEPETEDVDNPEWQAWRERYDKRMMSHFHSLVLDLPKKYKMSTKQKELWKVLISRDWHDDDPEWQYYEDMEYQVPSFLYLINPDIEFWRELPLTKNAKAAFDSYNFIGKMWNFITKLKNPEESARGHLQKYFEEGFKL